MCGIIYAHNQDKKNNSVNTLVKTLYHNQSERGAEGFGYAGFNDSHFFHERATTKTEIFEKMDGRAFSALLFHHRLPTSTDNRINACHPFRVESNGRVFLFAHNGQVINDYELQTGHKGQGIEYISEDIDYGKKYKSFNDSEALAWDFALYITGKQKNMKSRGSITFICLEVIDGQAGKLWYYHNGIYPLYKLEEGGLFVLASKGDFKSISKNRLFCFDFKNGKTEKRKLKLKADYPYQQGMAYCDTWTDADGKSWQPIKKSGHADGYNFFDYWEDYQLRTATDDDLIGYWYELEQYRYTLADSDPLFYEYLDECENELYRRGLA